jgi:putative transposase
MENTRRSQHVDLWAYVIMPEHVHVLLCPRQPSYEMRRILVYLKRPISDAARAYLEQTDNERWLDKLSVEYPSRTHARTESGAGCPANG